MNKRVINAIKINFRNIFFSTLVKLLLIFVTMISTIFCFWPTIYRIIEGEELLVDTVIRNSYVGIGIGYCAGMITVFLITRIGAQVGYSKGSMLTETILTSISRPQLYYSYVVSGVFVATVSLFIIIIPFIVAGIIRDNSMVFVCTGLHGITVFLLTVHILLTVYILISIVIALASLVKRAEDSGPLILLCLIPTLVSMIYVTVKGEFYTGVAYIFNLFPLTSWVPSIVVSVNSGLNLKMSLILICSDIVFLVAGVIFGSRIFTKNIAAK